MKKEEERHSFMGDKVQGGVLEAAVAVVVIVVVAAVVVVVATASLVNSRIVVVVVVVVVVVLFTFVWLVLEPPGTKLSYPDSREPMVILKCSSDDISFLVSLIYNMLLIIVCTVYAVKTRKIPENFNESKFIGFSMYTTCIIWLAFVPIYFGTLNSFKIEEKAEDDNDKDDDIDLDDETKEEEEEEEGR
ncbi:metabotropic glutamate receptor [Elysia marginata]|uniref:Metabotropic glutamate receptor n=1 Tax=Elysia marginata TaxID=1093978 RepID=A0AAV4H831_9GAST|nr:metabotropic glutamate receptor [Elysia marginata]